MTSPAEHFATAVKACSPRMLSMAGIIDSCDEYKESFIMTGWRWLIQPHDADALKYRKQCKKGLLLGGP